MYGNNFSTQDEAGQVQGSGGFLIFEGVCDVCTRAHGSQKETLDPLELELTLF